MTAAKDLRAKSPAELRRMLDKLAKQLSDLRIERSLGKLKNTTTLRQQRRETARVQTILEEKAVLDKKEVSESGGSKDA